MNLFPWSTVSSGESSERVSVIQYLLRSRGQSVTVDGSFGPATRTAVKAVQSAAGLMADGVVGPKTWPALVTTVRSGDSGDAVRALQTGGLVTPPWDGPVDVDGAFGPDTKERVEGFQYNWGLARDGVAGPQTWSFLTSGGGEWPLVRVGATQETNWRVRTVQHLLRAHGATIAADGTFGTLSGNAMKFFQLGLRATEISTTCGQLDWPELVVTVRRGDNGEAVRAAQVLLPDLAVDGQFGAKTEAAVRAFQDKFLATTDGIVGLKTWWALVVPSYG